MNPFIPYFSLLLLVDWAFSHGTFALLPIAVDPRFYLVLDRLAVLINPRMRIPRSVYDIEIQAQIGGHCLGFYLCYLLSVLFYYPIVAFMLVLFKEALHVCSFACTRSSQEHQVEIRFFIQLLLFHLIFHRISILECVLRRWICHTYRLRIKNIICEVFTSFDRFLLSFHDFFLLFADGLFDAQTFANLLFILYFLSRRQIFPIAVFLSTLITLRARKCLI